MNKNKLYRRFNSAGVFFRRPILKSDKLEEDTNVDWITINDNLHKRMVMEFGNCNISQACYNGGYALVLSDYDEARKLEEYFGDKLEELKKEIHEIFIVDNERLIGIYLFEHEKYFWRVPASKRGEYLKRLGMDDLLFFIHTGVNEYGEPYYLRDPYEVCKERIEWKAKPKQAWSIPEEDLDEYF